MLLFWEIHYEKKSTKSLYFGVNYYPIWADIFLSNFSKIFSFILYMLIILQKQNLVNLS